MFDYFFNILILIFHPFVGLQSLNVHSVFFHNVCVYTFIFVCLRLGGAFCVWMCRLVLSCDHNYPKRVFIVSMKYHRWHGMHQFGPLTVSMPCGAGTGCRQATNTLTGYFRKEEKKSILTTMVLENSCKIPYVEPAKVSDAFTCLWSTARSRYLCVQIHKAQQDDPDKNITLQQGDILLTLHCLMLLIVSVSSSKLANLLSLPVRH